MHTVLFGGTGRTGSEAAEALLARGATVTLFLRPSSVVPDTLAGRVREFRGNAVDSESAGLALVDADAAVICIGNDALLKRETIRTDVTRAVCEATRDSTVRVVVLSALGARNSGGQLPWYIRHFALFVLQQPLRDHNDQEDIVETVLPPERRLVLRPVQLSDGPFTGSYHLTEAGVTPSMSISRRDVAHFIVAQLYPDSASNGSSETENWFGKFVAMSS